MEEKTIVSPIPGVFYRKPSPDKEVYFNEGDTVKAGDIIGLVEVMKNYYEIKAEADGVIERFLADDEQLLDAGQEIAILK
ncbi:biotin carboxyl carrier domain-containing protein [Siminovitchia acidinfaciens]|uniref:Biotin carboxyl carrier protein of acetyl-CoA carboxylase n=1 Tax=Siminovitchia acidinfaciens TaxID=2321395 RepID=A0A429XWE4_9BACI|nr:acetyl-CoA carboxylase [Siminovitchia acidinfaciens]RST72714.1 biotin carboxyl carrier domain-containing protein [Siminovitchia acidinfaciens]VEF49311.1 biotin/lipoyl attachment domain-containing protein [Bacillus freudenreichii]